MKNYGQLQPGMEVTGFVKATSKKGCFVTLGEGVDARVLLSNLSDTFVADPAKAFPPARTIHALHFRFASLCFARFLLASSGVLVRRVAWVWALTESPCVLRCPAQGKLVRGTVISVDAGKGRADVSLRSDASTAASTRGASSNVPLRLPFHTRTSRSLG